MARPLGALTIALSLVACGGAPVAPERASPAFPPETPRLAAHVGAVHARFDPERALETVAYVEQFFRVRGNEGYQASIEHVVERLAAHGFEAGSVRVRALGPEQPTWTPRRARLALVGADGTETELVAFESERDRDRAALLVGSTAMAPVELEVVRTEAVRAGASARGRLVLASGRVRHLWRELVEPRGAVGLLVRDLEPYHQAERHPDAARFGYLPPHEGRVGIGFSLSEEDWRALRAATERGAIARVRVEIDARTGRSAATTVEARIEGTDEEAGAIVLVAHVDEPGANDNASGVAALVELAGALRRAIAEGQVAPPRRTLVFLWGQEIESANAWLERTTTPVAAGIVLDMVGLDPATGAPFLIERMPDPGAVWLRAPDEHTEWGAGDVDPARLRGHFLNDWVRAAAARIERLDGSPWSTRTHPYEGGSDHVAFLRRGLPAVLAWHFTDDAYHTTRDRLERVSGAEMRRVAAALGGATLSMASGALADRAEMLEVVRMAALERLEWARRAAEAAIARGGAVAEEQRIVRQWGTWYDEALRSVEAWDGDDGDDDALRSAVVAARGAVAEQARDAEAALR